MKFIYFPLPAIPGTLEDVRETHRVLTRRDRPTGRPVARIGAER